MTDRGASPAFIAELVRTHGARPVRFFEADFGVKGVFRSWTNHYAISWNGFTWNGGGDLLEIEGWDETLSGRTDRLTVVLADRDQLQVRDHVADALEADVHGRRAKIAEGFLSLTGDLVVDPVWAFAGEISRLYLRAGQKGALAIVCEIVEVVGDPDRESRHRITAESQALVDPTDKGLQFLKTIGQREIGWGTRYANRVQED